jgi:hypothetical protein
MASATIPSGDIQVACQRLNDEESTAVFAQDVYWQARAIGKARTAIERVKNGGITADIEGELHILTAVANDVAEKLAKNEFSDICLRFRCTVFTEHPNDAPPRYGSDVPILHRKTPTSVPL